MSNSTAQMVTHPKVKPRKPLRLAIKKHKIYYRLALVIDAVFDFEDPESKGYDLDNSKPWPLGHYDTERQAMAQRNAIVMIEPKATGDPKRDKLLLDGGALVMEGSFCSPDAIVTVAALSKKPRRM